MPYTRKRLFFVGIPRDHVRASIARAQRLGYEVILGDTAANLRSKASLIAGADRLEETDYTDYADLRSVALQLNKEVPIDAIFTFKEAGSVQTAAVAQDLGLRGNPPEVVESCNVKSKTRTLLQKAGLPSPAYKLCETLQDAVAFQNRLGRPVVVKPDDLQGSVGVKKAITVSQMPDAFRACQAESQRPAALVEELIKGREFSLEAMVSGGEVVLFGVTEKALYPDSFIESGHVSPAATQELRSCEYTALVERVVRAMGILYGPLHIETFQTDQELVVGEVHTRYGGDHIVQLTELVRGCDMTTPVFAELCRIPHKVELRAPAGVAGVRFPAVPPGIVTSIDGVEEVAALPGVVQVEVDCAVGDVVRSPLSSFDRVASIVAWAPTRASMEATLEEAILHLSIVTS